MEPSSNQNQGGAPKKPNRGGRGQKKYRGNNRGGKNFYNNNYSNNNRYPPQYPMYPQQHQAQYYNPYFQQQILYRTEMYICSKCSKFAGRIYAGVVTSSGNPVRTCEVDIERLQSCTLVFAGFTG